MEVVGSPSSRSASSGGFAHAIVRACRGRGRRERRPVGAFGLSRLETNILEHIVLALRPFDPRDGGLCLGWADPAGCGDDGNGRASVVGAWGRGCDQYREQANVERSGHCSSQHRSRSPIRARTPEDGARCGNAMGSTLAPRIPESKGASKSSGGSHCLRRKILRDRRDWNRRGASGGVYRRGSENGEFAFSL